MTTQMSQARRILRLLEDAYPGTASALSLSSISLSYTRRITDLRRAGHQIELIDEWTGRQRRTRYRLVKP